LSKLVPTTTERAFGALLGLAAGRKLALGERPDGTAALMLLLAEELVAGHRDLRALAHRWVARHLSDQTDIEPETNAALTHLARHDAPPSHAAGQGSDPLLRTVPVALAFHDAPRTLVSATYHIAALTHPDPLVAWSAVAVNVALARFLGGKRDFVPDVIEVLRSNKVPELLLAAIRRVPLRAQAAEHGSVPGEALGDMEAALRLAYHEPVLERGLVGVAGGGPPVAARAGLAGALLGARNGAAALPAGWKLSTERSFFLGLAERLTARTRTRA
jgi:ADP-ribosylglycohydrolase